MKTTTGLPTLTQRLMYSCLAKRSSFRWWFQWGYHRLPNSWTLKPVDVQWLIFQAKGPWQGLYYSKHVYLLDTPRQRSEDATSMPMPWLFLVSQWTLPFFSGRSKVNHVIVGLFWILIFLGSVPTLSLFLNWCFWLAMFYVVNYEVSIGVPDLLSGITGTSSISIRLTPVSRTRFLQQINQPNPYLDHLENPDMDTKCLYTWWLIPVSKWIITPVISELTLLSPVITRGITYLLSGGEPPSRPFLDVFPLGSSARRRRADRRGWARPSRMARTGPPPLLGVEGRFCHGKLEISGI
jgi:hypothetical protein